MSHSVWQHSGPPSAASPAASRLPYGRPATPSSSHGSMPSWEPDFENHLMIFENSRFFRKIIENSFFQNFTAGYFWMFRATLRAWDRQVGAPAPLPTFWAALCGLSGCSPPPSGRAPTWSSSTCRCRPRAGIRKLQIFENSRFFRKGASTRGSCSASTRGSCSKSARGSWEQWGAARVLGVAGEAPTCRSHARDNQKHQVIKI